jgi:hypothetical protein
MVDQTRIEVAMLNDELARLQEDVDLYDSELWERMISLFQKRQSIIADKAADCAIDDNDAKIFLQGQYFECRYWKEISKKCKKQVDITHGRKISLHKRLSILIKKATDGRS